MLDNAGTTTVPPGSGDNVLIGEFVVNTGIPVLTMPTLAYDAGTISQLFLGVQFLEGTSSLTITDGGNLTSSGLTGVGWQPGTVGTLEMTGGTHSTAALYLGHGGTGTINLSGDALLDVTTATFAAGANGGSGSMTMDGNAMFSVFGDLTGSGLENTLITAVGAGDSIEANLVGGNTEYTVIPEPATLSLVGLVGGGLLWIRKRFMI
jgi:hypothetical protein